MVDDHPIVATSVANMLEQDERFTARNVADGKAALAAVKESAPDVILCDINLDRHMTGLELVRRVLTEAPASRIVMFTSYTDPDTIAAAIDAGAIGYLTKSTPPTELADHLATAARGMPVYDAATQNTVIALFRNRTTVQAPALLTEREQEVLELLCRSGGTSKELAEELQISEQTVRTHVERICAKLGVNGRAKAITTAFRLGLVRPDIT